MFNAAKRLEIERASAPQDENKELRQESVGFAWIARRS